MAKMRYNPPPNWPTPPPGWSPEPGWQPDPAWGPAPKGWKLYKDPRNWFMRHKILSGVLALVLIGIIGSVANGGGSSNSTDTNAGASSASSAATQPSTSSAVKSAPAAPEPAAPKGAGLNQPVRDGNFEFTVKSIQCGLSQVGDSNFGQKAQGQFCLVKLHVSNIGQDARMLDGSSQYAFDAQGRKFDSDLGAAIYLGQDAQTFLNNINPGNAVDGTVVFDVPKTVKVAQLELHDSAFSGGVQVRVS